MKNTVFGSTLVDAIALVIVFAGLGVLLAGGFLHVVERLTRNDRA